MATSMRAKYIGCVILWLIVTATASVRVGQWWTEKTIEETLPPSLEWHAPAPPLGTPPPMYNKQLQERDAHGDLLLRA